MLVAPRRSAIPPKPTAAQRIAPPRSAPLFQTAPPCQIVYVPSPRATRRRSNRCNPYPPCCSRRCRNRCRSNGQHRPRSVDVRPRFVDVGPNSKNFDNMFPNSGQLLLTSAQLGRARDKIWPNSFNIGQHRGPNGSNSGYMRGWDLPGAHSGHRPIRNFVCLFHSVLLKDADPDPLGDTWSAASEMSKIGTPLGTWPPGDFVPGDGSAPNGSLT